MKTEHRVPTVERTIDDDLTIAIPCGSLDKPSDESQRLMQVLQDPGNWKLPPTPYHTYDEQAARDLAYCYDYYLGGHEFDTLEHNGRTLYEITSHGYYHYIGA